MNKECEHMMKSFIECKGRKNMMCYYDERASRYLCNFKTYSCELKENDTKYMLSSILQNTLSNEYLKINQYNDDKNCKGIVLYTDYTK